MTLQSYPSIFGLMIKFILSIKNAADQSLICGVQSFYKKKIRYSFFCEDFLESLFCLLK